MGPQTQEGCSTRFAARPNSWKSSARRIPHKITAAHEKLAQLQHTLMEPAKTKSEVLDQQARARRLRDEGSSSP